MRHQTALFATPDRLRIFYQVWSPDAAPRGAVLIVHGIGEHGGRYLNYVDWLVPRGYALYAPDLRGCGRSEGQRGHVDRFDDFVRDVRQMREVARAAEPGAPLFLLGHSFGSLVALTAGLRYPADWTGVIVSGAAFLDALPYPHWVRSSIRRLGQAVPRVSMPSGLNPAYVSRDARVVDAYRRDPLVHGRGTLRWASESIMAREWLRAHAGEWTLPLLMLHGAADQVCLVDGAQAFFQQLPAGTAEFRSYPEMYHEVHNDFGKEEVFRAVEEWLEERLARRP